MNGLDILGIVLCVVALIGACINLGAAIANDKRIDVNDRPASDISFHLVVVSLALVAATILTLLLSIALALFAQPNAIDIKPPAIEFGMSDKPVNAPFDSTPCGEGECCMSSGGVITQYNASDPECDWMYQ